MCHFIPAQMETEPMKTRIQINEMDLASKVKFWIKNFSVYFAV